MQDIVLFNKSYKGDLNRVINLSKSIHFYNKDGIPFIISVPKEDVGLFKEEIPFYDDIIADDEIYAVSVKNGWKQQQLIKSKFYKLGVSWFYVCIDSDSYFIRDFGKNDFFNSDGIPYMVMHENKDFFEFTDGFKNQLGFDPRKSYTKEYNSIHSHLFGHHDNRVFHYGPSPFIWNTDVWNSADNEFGIENLFDISYTELKWYGELVKYYKYDYIPIQPLFKVFHYQLQYDIYKKLGYMENNFQQNYLGIGLQSNWGAPLKF